MVWLWPVDGSTDKEIWEGDGKFLHGTLAIQEVDVCQDNMEAIEQAIDDQDHAERKGVVVKFFDKQKRDLVMTSSPNLSSRFENDGKPTAGMRLEIPPELADTFRLLSRFGSRPSSGTKHHTKFDI